MFAHFFITRPVFAVVLSVLIMLAGGAGPHAAPDRPVPGRRPPAGGRHRHLPRGRRPDRLRDRRRPDRGAGERRRGDAVHGVAGTNDGAMRLTVTFKLGTNPDMAQVLVQNRVAIATPEAPGGRPPARASSPRSSPPPSCSSSTCTRPGRRRTTHEVFEQQLAVSRHANLAGQGRAGPHRRRRRRVPVRQPRLRHAGLARPGEDDRPEPGARPRWWTRSASRTCRWRPGRSASRRPRAGRPGSWWSTPRAG